MRTEPDDTGRPRQTWLVVLGDDECEQLLTQATLGRLAVVVDGRPEIFPVSYLYDAGTRSVVFPTNDRTKFKAALGWPYVGFEVDGHEGDEGWSVSLVGQAVEVDQPTAIDLTGRKTMQWRPGSDTRWIRVVAEKISGRRIGAPR